MEMMFSILAVLNLTFSLALAWYLAGYKLKAGGGLTRGLTMTLLFPLNLVTVCSLTVFLAWPPVLPW